MSDAVLPDFLFRHITMFEELLYFEWDYYSPKQQERYGPVYELGLAKAMVSEKMNGGSHFFKQCTKNMIYQMRGTLAREAKIWIPCGRDQISESRRLEDLGNRG